MERTGLFIYPLLIAMAALGALGNWQAKAQPPQAKPRNGALDTTIRPCADFSVTESHLDSAFHTVIKGYETIPGQEQPVPQIEGVETPEKLQEFMTWYANGGQRDMFAAGEECRGDTLVKYGENEAAKVGFFIAMERARNAEFFADKLLKQCTGVGLKK
jgi:hypothetical protein